MDCQGDVSRGKGNRQAIQIDEQVRDGSEKEQENIYDPQIETWIKDIGKYFEKQGRVWPLSSEYFKKVFLPRVERKMRLAVVFDSLAGRCIMEKLKQPQYSHFSQQPLNLAAALLRLDQPSTVQPALLQQKWLPLLKISQILYLNAFITKKAYKETETLALGRPALQQELAQFYRLSQQKRGKEEGEKDRVSISLWGQIVSVGCREFWMELVFLWPSLVRDSQVMRRLYGNFEVYLVRKLGKKETFKLKQFIFGATQQKKQKGKQIDYILKMGDLCCLFSYPKKVKAIQAQLDILQGKLLTAFQLSNKTLKILNFETYGSFRNKICLPTSDVDLTALIADQTNLVDQSRPFIEHALTRLFYCLYKFYKLNDPELRIQSVFSVVKCRVPFIRIRFQNCMPVNSVDIVVNNYDGVRNSRVLERYAEVREVRGMAVAVKKWGKRNRLIDPMKLSSYGLTLMLLFFLMSQGYLQFPTLDQLTTFQPPTHFKTHSQTLATLHKFFTFYSRSSPFILNQQIACIIKNCRHHETILNSNYIINIHDPFDGSNPGRLKEQDRFLFFGAVDRAVEGIQGVMRGGGRREEGLDGVFGFQGGEGQDLGDGKDLIVID